MSLELGDSATSRAARRASRLETIKYVLVRASGIRLARYFYFFYVQNVGVRVDKVDKGFKVLLWPGTRNTANTALDASEYLIIYPINRVSHA